MDKTKLPKASVRTLIRRALKNRYVLSEVRIMRDGTVTGTVGGGYPDIPFGNVSEYTWVRTDAMNIRLLRNGNTVFTFAHDS